ncbi:hypothetical protein SEPCBS119000_001668 [Sporothrix epigloea]|uniref:Uncharacterized protein n=1 Tax=Sporothrix epigloea TaxID=1892477 RepID=A0ABP0DBZ6_9PEZI
MGRHPYAYASVRPRRRRVGNGIAQNVLLREPTPPLPSRPGPQRPPPVEYLSLPVNTTLHDPSSNDVTMNTQVGDDDVDVDDDTPAQIHEDTNDVDIAIDEDLPPAGPPGGGATGTDKVQNHEPDMDKFVLAFSQYVRDFRVPQEQYAALREIVNLKLPASRNPLPRDRKTLLRRGEKMKSSTRTTETALQADKLETVPKMDTKTLITRYMASSSSAETESHVGLAHFVDSPSEAHNSRSWAASVRTTGGEFAHILIPGEDGELKNGQPVFPSDVVKYTCLDSECPCNFHHIHQSPLYHVGRVSQVGKDYRSNYCTVKQGEIALSIQEIVRPLYKDQPRLHNLQSEVKHTEDLIIDLQEEYVSEDSLVEVVTGQVRWATSEQSAMTTTAGGGARTASSSIVGLVCRARSISGRIIPLDLTHQIKGGHELELYSRAKFEKWDRQYQSNQMLQ